MLNVTLWLAFISGLISFISPCMLPLVPAYVGYMGNRVTAQVTSGTTVTSDVRASTALFHQHRFQMALHGITFVLGFMVVFVGFGLVITAGTQVLASAFYDVQHLIIPRVGGVFIMLFGLHFIGLLVPALHWLERRAVLDRLGKLGRAVRRGLGWLQNALYADTRPHVNLQRSHGLIGSGLMGIVFAAGWTPCIGPIYGTILTLAASNNGNLLQAAGLLVMYSLGMGVPFILTALALDRVKGLFRRLNRHLNTLKVASGVLMILIGVFVYTGDLQRIAQLGASRAQFTYRIETCAVDFFNGTLPASKVGDCLSRD